MINKSKDIEIDEDFPFKNCHLDRKKYADVLTQLVSSSPEGFVMSINNKWGTGKSTFVKMWQQTLNISKFSTIYFNAWENDFEDNALIALMGELKTVTKKSTEKSFKNVLEKAAIIGKNALPIIASSLSKKYLDEEKVGEVVKAISESASSIFEKDVNEYASKKKGIHDFRKELEKFISDSGDGKPIVFIIDELDRCRPNYAVSILEQIKHFFAVKGITFILSIDKEQLGHAICGVYGNPNIDSPEYLRRFIDFEYTIPDPNVENFIKSLFFKYRFDEMEGYFHKNHLGHISHFLFTSFRVTLRQQEKIFAHISLITKGYFNFRTDSFEVLCFLIFIRMYDYQIFKNIYNKFYTTQEFQKMFKDLFTTKIISNNHEYLMGLEQKFIFVYCSYIGINPRSEFLNSEGTVSVKSLISNNYIYSIGDTMTDISLTGGLKKYFDAIEMLEQITDHR